MTTVAVPVDVRRRCVFCRDNGHLRPEQLLVAGSHAYLCVPRGQVVEGFLAIAANDCASALSQLSAAALAEVRALQALAEAFYRAVHGTRAATFYEQGRGGGDARFDAALRFPHHAHLCGVPVAVDVHHPLGARFRGVRLGGLLDVPAAAGSDPYVYVDAAESGRARRRCVYVPRTDADRTALEEFRLKPVLAQILGLDGRGDWRRHPGDEEVARVIADFRRWRRAGREKRRRDGHGAAADRRAARGGEDGA